MLVGNGLGVNGWRCSPAPVAHTPASYEVRRFCVAEALQTMRKFAAMPAVEEVNHQPDGKPDEERDPGEDLKAHHQQDAEDNAQQREQRPKRRTEAAMPIRFAVA